MDVDGNGSQNVTILTHSVNRRGSTVQESIKIEEYK